MAETVWDNTSGAFADVKESKQIGFTQDYSKLIPAAAAGGVLGGAVGGAVVGATAGPDLVDTRIVIPFGRILSEVFQSGLQRAFPNSSVCSDDSSETARFQVVAPAYFVRLRIQEFQVWEKPLNHINLKAVVVSSVYRAGRTGQPYFIYEARHEAANQSIGSTLSTSSGFISEMSKVSNRFAAAVSKAILENLHSRIEE